MAALVPSHSSQQAILITETGLYPEPLVGAIWGVALSDYEPPAEPVMAVARVAFPKLPTQRNAVVLYRLEERSGTAQLVPDRIFPAEAPAFPAFRGLAP
jgi:hypothetical protein